MVGLVGRGLQSDVRAMKLARVQSELHALKMSASDLSRSSDKALREKESESDKLRHEMIRVKHRLEHTSAEAAELRVRAIPGTFWQREIDTETVWV